MNRIDGKVAVITRGTQGLGTAIALFFAQAGAAGLAICGRTAAKGNAVAQRIASETGVKTVFVAADLNSVDDCRSVIEQAHRTPPRP